MRSPGPPPAMLLVLGGIVSVQVGAAVAEQLFPVVGPAAPCSCGSRWGR